MIIKKTFENLLQIIPIIIISNIIYIIYTSQFSGGLAGMAPFTLILNSIISFVASFIIYLCVNVKFKLNQPKSILIFTLVSFLTLIIYFTANPFNYGSEKIYRDLDLWLYISILISSFLMITVKKIVTEEK